MDDSSKLKLIKLMMLLYVASFLAINWNEVSWIFNYKEMGGLISAFFNPYPESQVSAVENFYPNHSSAQMQPAQQKEKEYAFTDKDNVLEIPKINISVPIIFSQSTNNASLLKDLDKGVVFYPGSAFPGSAGQMIILGHSAPDGWPKIKHDWVFSDLNDLAEGDKVMIDVGHKQYVYTVRQKSIIQKGQDVTTNASTTSENVVILVSCWPPGKDYQRIAVEAVLDK